MEILNRFLAGASEVSAVRYDMATDTQNQHSLLQGQTFVWHELYTPNAPSSIDFYTKVLGLGTQEMDMGPNGTYKMLTKNGAPICGVFPTNTPEMADVPPHWSVYYSVDDVDASLAKAQEHGATVLVPPMDVPTVGRMVLIKDPQGATLWLFTPSPQG